MLRHQKITFERTVNGRIHRFSISTFCNSAFDVAINVCERAARRNIEISFIDLMYQLKA